MPFQFEMKPAPSRNDLHRRSFERMYCAATGLISEQEARRILGVSIRTMYELRKSGIRYFRRRGEE